MIIADTGAILATIDQSSAWHEACVKVLAQLQRPMVISPMVVAEADYLLSKRFGIATANRFLSDVARGAYQLVPADERDVDEAVTVNTRYFDLKLGVTDSLNVVLASRYGTSKIFTLDERHFRVIAPLCGTAAFTLLPADLS